MKPKSEPQPRESKQKRIRKPIFRKLVTTYYIHDTGTSVEMISETQETRLTKEEYNNEVQKLKF